ncbi:ulp1 protease family, C-terminal catalytic domain-containing protein [Artemisia annua]|uniref:Ulp1 protease family, C-terminal catalytic domain-containing protein n=1 Tax=Artemisia annua TaxID=35608 RepID=A0A2U1NUX2_ARTAN|nr:ulp1 protease family, C-terminal catalytic domain-containing protein [Artemisia annua]
MVKAKKAPTKKAEPKKVQKRGAKAVEEDKEDVILKEKRTVKPSNAMKSPFYDRKVHIYQKWSEAEMKLVEYMWSDSTPESDIVFNGKGLQIEGVFFLSLYPEIEVAAPIIDVWSIILNNEEQFRDELSQKRNVYCSTLMLPHRMVDFDDGMELEKRRNTFEENFKSVLKNSGLKDINDVGLIFFPCIKMTESGSNHYYVICFNLKNGNIDILDNIDNGIEDISARYGKYAQVLSLYVAGEYVAGGRETKFIVREGEIELKVAMGLWGE